MQKLLLIVDLEATCWDGDVPWENRRQTVDDMEVIEFGCVVATFDGVVIDSKSFLVRPVLHPSLSTFCTQLTSIKQQDVDSAPLYGDVSQQIDQWLEQYELVCWGSWGYYDKNQLLAERVRHDCAPAFLDLEHVNLKTVWREGRASNRRSGLTHALSFHNLEFAGTYHRGIDDALNIARLLTFINLDLRDNQPH